MTKIYWEKDANTSALHGKTVAVLGYGSQGRAHAMNLRDSGCNVVLGLRPEGKTWKQAEEDGFKPETPAEAVRKADIVAMLCPDMAQAELYREAVAPNLKKNAALLFAHGFNVHYKEIQPHEDIDVIMVAPKGPGNLVRRQFEEKRGVPCLVAVHQDASKAALEKALAYAHGIGGTKAGVLETTFKEETETDLFGEQAVLCGGTRELIVKGWETLVEAGYQPDVAYFECLHELKLIVDLLYEGGFERMHEFISETAKYGDFTRGPRVVDDHVKQNMKQVLTEIQDGTFARQWIEETKSGRKDYHAQWKKCGEHPIEETGKKLREHMSWIAAKKGKTEFSKQLTTAGKQ
jgi:ketol-acid reductoisomerase